MKQTLLFAISLLLIAVSCKNSTTSKSEKLLIKTYEITGMLEDQVKKETINEVDSDYFEISLDSQTTGGYLAHKDLVKPTSVEDFKSTFITIVDQAGEAVIFMTSTEFLNYMSGHGYEMVDQALNEYGGDYTFKRK